MSAEDEAKELTRLARAALQKQDLGTALRYLKLAQQLDDTEKVRKRIQRIEDALRNLDKSDSESDPEFQSEEIMDEKRRKSLNTSRAIAWDSQTFFNFFFSDSCRLIYCYPIVKPKNILRVHREVHKTMRKNLKNKPS